MRKTIVLAGLLTLMPFAAGALGTGMGMYGTASFGGGGGGNATNGDGREDYEIAIRLMDKGEFDSAITRLNRVLRIQQGNADILNDLGYASRMAGDYDSAVDYLQRAISRKSDLKAAYTNLGETYLALHQPDEARKQLAALSALCPTGCDEKDELAQSIAVYSAKPSPPASPPAH